MIDVNIIVNMALASDLMSIETSIDQEMLERAKEGRNNYSIVIAKEAKEAKEIYKKYKQVSEKYKEKYEISYG